MLLTGVVTQAQVDFGKQRHTIYLVRHAEKKTGNDPALTVAGQERAGDLYRCLKDKKIKRIYTTGYHRTIMTGDSLRIYRHIDTAQYDADTLSQSLPQLIIANKDAGSSILVIGHSNTIPALIRKLGVTGFTLINLPDTEFDDLFVISYRRGKAKLEQYRYGKPSGSKNNNIE